jgi:hypothetical protein
VITIRHAHEDGTLVEGTSKGDGTAVILKAHRFRWFPSLGLWGIPQSRDHLAKRGQIEAAAAALRAAGHEVTVEIDDTPRDAGQVKADRADRLEDRREALDARAGRVGASALAHLAEADRIAKSRPFGQPILVGHHSERGARADQRRIERNMDRFCEEYGQAKELGRRAAAVGRDEAYRERPEVIIRRIATLEADLRRIERDIAGESAPGNWREKYYAPERKPAAGERLAQLEAARTFTGHQLQADRQALAERQASGYRCHSRETVHVGDIIHIGSLGPRKVVRVSAKSVSVETSYTWTDRVSYERITRVDCPHDSQETP